MIQSNVRGAVSRAGSVRAFVATSVVCAVLAACGGGGGSSSPPPVSIQPSATTTSANGQSITLTATLSGSTAGATPTWTISGPGSLSASSGASVTYLPPDPENDANDGAATVTITASDASGHSQQVQIALSAVTVPGHHWSVGAAPVANFEAITYANGMFLATGGDGVVATSPDGTTWTRHDVSGGDVWSPVAVGSGWMMLGGVSSADSLLTSPDGVTWTSKPLPAAAAGTEPIQLIYQNGIYVMLGYSGGSLVSTDGTNWTKLSLTGFRVAYGNGVFVVSGGDKPVWSTDGMTWTASTQNVSFNDLMFGNGHFLGTNGLDTYTSTDGKTWTLAGHSTAYIGSDGMSFVNGKFYETTSSGYFSTVDGTSWTAVTLPLDTVSFMASGGGKVVAVGYEGGIASGPDADHLSVVNPDQNGGDFGGAFYADGTYLFTSGGVVSSKDGKTWTAATIPVGGGLDFTADEINTNGFAQAPDGTIVVSGYVANNTTGALPAIPAAFAWSADGTTWQLATVQGATAGDSGSGPVIHDGKRFVSISGRRGAIFTSADGRSWSAGSSITLPQNGMVNGLAYGNGRYVAVGINGFATTSTDATTWTAAAKILSTDGQTPLVLNSVVFAAGKFVAIGYGGVAATSTDGVTWSVAATAAPVSTNPDIPTNMTGMTVSTTGEIVAVGTNGVIETSRDGVHWTLRVTGRSESLSGVAATPTGFFAGGSYRAVLVSTN